MVNPIAPALSGLKTFEKKMRVTANNIANVNTSGFKASRLSSQETLGETVSTAAGTARVGGGTTVGDIVNDFSQGSFESTDSPTDLAIGGQGFFVVRDPGHTDALFYTRTGTFEFDQNGNLTTPGGYIARGWPVDSSGQAMGAVQDITLPGRTSPPNATTRATIIANLDANATSNTASLELAWDGDNAGGAFMGSDSYNHQASFEVYDSLGNTHDITLYFDPAASDNTWEFIVTSDPSDDLRTTASGDGLGLLARGTMTFNPSGTVTAMSMRAYNGAAGIGIPGNWTPVAPNPDGYLAFSPTFVSATPMTVALDLGTRYNATTSAWEPASPATTQYAQASTTVFQSANGYGSAALQSVSVDTNGVLTGQYSNGEVIPLFQLALANFQNVQGLDEAGGNLYRETRLSGTPVTGAPGTSGLGGIAPNALEQSNVDIAKEIVSTITIQRGFEANAKVVKVTDEMLESVIDLFA